MRFGFDWRRGVGGKFSAMSDAFSEPPPPELDPIAQVILEHLSLQNPPQDVKPMEVAKIYAEKRSKPGPVIMTYRFEILINGQNRVRLS